MNKDIAFAIVIFIAVILGGCALLGFALTPAAEGAVATWEQEASAARMQAEADLTEAKASETKAEADLVQAHADEVQAQASLEAAKGDRRLKEGQAQALNTAADASAKTVATSNRLVTLWGVSFPMMPPLYLLIGAVFGIMAAFPAGYAIALRTTHKAPQPAEEKETQPTLQPDIVGA